MSCTRFSHAFQLSWKWALEPLCLISNLIKNNGNHSLIDLYKPVIMTAVKGSLSRFFNAYLCAVLLSRVSSFPENLVNVTWTICCSISNRPLYCLCPWGNMPRKIYFSTAVEVLSRAHPRHPATPPPLLSHGWSFQTIGCVHRGINGFCEASQTMEGTEPSSEWGTAGFPLLVTAWVCLCPCAIVAADLCSGSEVLYRVPKSHLPSTVLPLLLLNAN